MVQKELISVVIPIYKAAHVLKKCINSIISQSYNNLEIICVIDASPDESVQIVKSFMSKDSRIRLVENKNNYGVDYSRFEGLRVSTGKYLTFVDSDDWLPVDALEVLEKKIEIEKADVVYGSLTKVIDCFGLIKKKGKNNYSESQITTSIETPLLFDEYYISYFGVNRLLVSMCGKLYKKEVILRAHLRPSYFKMGEDLFFNMQLHPFLEKIAFVEDNVYNYRWGGMTNKMNSSFLSDIKTQYKIKKEKIEQYQYDKAMLYIKYELANCFFSHFLNYKFFDKVTDEELKNKIEIELHDEVYLELKDISSKKAQLLFTKNMSEIVLLIKETYKNQIRSYKIKRFINLVLN